LSLRQKYLTILTNLAPVGAVGLSVALGAATPVAASEEPAGTQPPVTQKPGMSERLAAVQEAVSALAETTADTAKADGRLAWGNWWYHGGGWGWPNWNNWHNWNNWGNWFRNW
jgi:hypothetical protein